MTDLLNRLDEAAALGFGLCSEAAIALRNVENNVKGLRKRHAASRADKLAAAYSILVARLRELRDLANDLGYYGSTDVDVDPLEIGTRLREQLDAISLDPEDIGARIVADAARTESLVADVRYLTAKIADAGGLGAANLLELPIVIERLDYDPINTKVTLCGSGRGATYLIDLNEKLRKALRS